MVQDIREKFGVVGYINPPFPTLCARKYTQSEIEVSKISEIFTPHN